MVSLIPDIIIIGIAGTAMNVYEQLTDARDRYNYPVNKISAVIDKLPEVVDSNFIEISGKLADIPLLLKDKRIMFIYLLHKPEKLEERHRLVLSLNIPGDRYFSFIHPGSFVAPSAKICYGNVVLSNSTIQSGVRMGNFNIINSGVTIEHGSVIGDFNFIAANCIIGADVQIGNTNFFGLGSAIREKTVIGKNLFAGMGSLILDNFTDIKVKGQPAKPF